jgi:hypothetical protein
MVCHLQNVSHPESIQAGSTLRASPLALLRLEQGSISATAKKGTDPDDNPE